jgi:hypothetical protein
MLPISETNPRAAASRFDYRAAPVLRTEHEENSITRLIEQVTAKIPSNAFLFAALGAMGASLVFELSGRTRLSRFVGQWAPTLLCCGIYNKLVKIAGAQ